MSSPACYGHEPELWFAKPFTEEAVEARAICRECPLIEPCLETTLEYEGTLKLRYGIYGGLYPEERALIGQRALA